jgi:hypothetical protein
MLSHTQSHNSAFILGELVEDNSQLAVNTIRTTTGTWVLFLCNIWLAWPNKNYIPIILNKIKIA